MQMPEEVPELGKFVIASFEQQSLSFPIIVVARDPTISGYVLQAIGDSCPDPRYSATHIFTGVTVTHLNNRVLWKYEKLPGVAITTTRLDDDGVTVTVTNQRVVNASIVTSEAVAMDIWTRKWGGEGDSVASVQITESRPINGGSGTITATKYDPESDTVYTESRTRKETSTITEGGSNVGTTQVIIESDPITALVAWEVKKIFPEAVAKDLASAITISEESAPYQFPATVDSTQYAASGGLIGYTKAFVRHVPHLTKVFFVIGTKPALTDYVVPPASAAMFALTLGGDPISDAIYDGVALLYNGITATYPGSTPNMTVYLSTWVGNPMPVLGSVREAGSKFRWKVEVTFITFLLPSLPTYS